MEESPIEIRVVICSITPALFETPSCLLPLLLGTLLAIRSFVRPVVRRIKYRRSSGGTLRAPIRCTFACTPWYTAKCEVHHSSTTHSSVKLRLPAVDTPAQMFIAIVGTRASGKSSVSQYLVAEKGFHLVKLIVRLSQCIFCTKDDRQTMSDIRIAEPSINLLDSQRTQRNHTPSWTIFVMMITGYPSYK